MSCEELLQSNSAEQPRGLARWNLELNACGLDLGTSYMSLKEKP